MKNRIFVILSIILRNTGLLGIILNIFVDYPTILWRIFHICLLIGIFFDLFCLFCPFCRKAGVRPNPFAKNAGRCKHCGNLIEYKQIKRRKEKL